MASSPNPRERSGAAQYSEGGRGEAALRVAQPPVGPSEKAKVSLNIIKYGMHEKSTFYTSTEIRHFKCF